MCVKVARWVPLNIIIPSIITVLLKLLGYLLKTNPYYSMENSGGKKKCINVAFWKQAKVIWMLPKIFDWVMYFGISCCDSLAEHCLLFKWNFSQLIRWSVAGIENICPAKYHKSENPQAGWIMKQKSFQQTAWQLVEKFPAYYLTKNETILLIKTQTNRKTYYWLFSEENCQNILIMLFARNCLTRT